MPALILLFLLALTGIPPAYGEIRQPVEAGPYGDGKFIQLADHLYYLTQRDNELRILEFGVGCILISNRPLGISATWVSAEVQDQKIVIAVASFREPQVRIYRLNPVSLHTELLHSITPQAPLAIDPALSRYHNTWYLTFTEILGNINNRDPQKENGQYTIRITQSPDAKSWQTTRELLSRKKNLEDPRLVNQGTLNLIFEEETIDQGSSVLKRLRDVTVPAPIEEILLDNGADNEPAATVKLKGQDLLMYSSDQEAPRASYQGGKIYALALDSYKSNRSPPLFSADKGVLLVDAIVRDDSILFAVLSNYDSARALECIEVQYDPRAS
jgi:hypothetical protein